MTSQLQSAQFHKYLIQSQPLAQLVFHQAGEQRDLEQCLRPLGNKAEVHQDIDALVGAIARQARPGDRVLVMSNGGFGGIHGKLLKALEPG